MSQARLATTPLCGKDHLTPQDIWDAGWEIKPDGDYFRFSARFFVEDSGRCDTPEEAARKCRQLVLNAE